MYDHRYPTKTCGRSNPTVRSSWDNVSSPSGGRISREGFRRLPTPRRSGARVDGMANSGELLINVVRSNKPKALTGLNQKVRGQVQRDPPSPVVVNRATGGQAEPKPSVIHPWNVVSPSSSLRGRFAARRNRWGGSRAYARLALHRMEKSLADGSSAPGAYREGRRGGQME